MKIYTVLKGQNCSCPVHCHLRTACCISKGSMRDLNPAGHSSPAQLGKKTKNSFPKSKTQVREGREGERGGRDSLSPSL